MNKLTDRPPMSRTDKLCLVALAGVILAVSLVDWMMDTAEYQAKETDKPQVEVVEIVPPIDCTPLVEAVEAMRSAPYDETIQLDRECQTALWEACEEYSIAPCLVLGLIEVESGFNPEADNGVSKGLMQLNSKYYPADLTPAENIRAGVAHLAGQIERYDGDIQAALRGYNKGWDDGDRAYARAVLDASDKWGCG